MGDESITDAKANFLRSQIRLLSTPLQPSTQWRDLVPDPEEGHIPDKVIQDVVSKVNDKIQQHNRMVYSAQSQRHIAEQIETLYWNQIKAEEDDGDVDAVIVRRKSELTASHVIQGLPENYEELYLHPRDEPAIPRDALQYSQLRSRLLELSRRRDDAQHKLAKYKQLQELLILYENPQANIQPNLVTKDGQLGKELDKMRVLLARVTARIGEADGNSVDSMSRRTPALTDDQKLRMVMDLT